MPDEETIEFLKKFGLYSNGNAARVPDQAKFRLAFTSLGANLPSSEAYRDFCQMGADILEEERKANRARNGEISLPDENGSVSDTFAPLLCWDDLSFVVDRELAENGAYKTQDEWIKSANEQGKIVMGAGHLYQVGKSGDSELIASIQKDCRENWVCLGDRFIYNPVDLRGKIISFYGSTVIAPVKKELVIPVYSRISVDEVLAEEQGLKYQQAFWNTTDGPEEIKGNLERLTGKNSDQIYVWTPDQKSRKNYPGRAAGVGVYSGSLDLLCVVRLDGGRPARWVVLEDNPAGAR